MTSRYLPILRVLGISVTNVSFPLFFLLVLTEVFKHILVSQRIFG